MLNLLIINFLIFILAQGVKSQGVKYIRALNLPNLTLNESAVSL